MRNYTLACLAAFVCTFGAATAATIFSDGFEAADGHGAPPADVTNNVARFWMTAESNTATIATNIFEDPDRVMCFTGESMVSNNFNGGAAVTANTNGVVDMMIKPTFWTEDTPPTVSNDVQAAVYFDSNGFLSVWHSVAPTFTTSKWTEVSHPAFSTSAWIRLTISMNYGGVYDGIPYVGDNSFGYYYQVQINGVALTNATHGWPDPSDDSGNPVGGSWFPQGDTVYNGFLSNVVFEGNGYVDDFTLRTEELSPTASNYYTLATATNGPGTIVRTPPATALAPLPGTYFQGVDVGLTGVPDSIFDAFSVWSGDIAGADNPSNIVMDTSHTVTGTFVQARTGTNMVPLSWLNNYGLALDDGPSGSASDGDGDGHTAAEEFVTGHDPTNGMHYLHIVSNVDSNGSNVISWLGGTLGSDAPYSIEATTNLIGGTWTNVAAGIAKVAGTQSYTVARADDVHFVRVASTNDAP